MITYCPLTGAPCALTGCSTGCTRQIVVYPEDPPVSEQREYHKVTSLNQILANQFRIEKKLDILLNISGADLSKYGLINNRADEEE